MLWKNLKRSAMVWAVACVGAATVPGRLPAQWPDGNEVTETVHNLRHTAQVEPMSEFFRDYGETCIYCHTPHGGGTIGPLWNRPTPSGPYRMYDRSPLDMIMDPQPTGNSLACLSCHDGTIGLDEIINVPNDYSGGGARREPIETCATECHTGGDPEGGFNWENVWFRPDRLRDQHPISILYDPSRDPTFRSIAEVEAAGIRLYDGKVQCGSCHNPHSQQNRPFLRVSNAGGTMCSVCHLTATSQTTAHFW